MRSLNQSVTTITLAATATLGVWSGSAKAASLTIGQNFTGTTVLDVARLNNGLSFTPPDTIGAVGTDHIVGFTNGSFTIYDKTTATRLQQLSHSQFWTDIAGIELNRGLTLDPRVVYDVASERWFAAAVNREFDQETQFPISNNYLLAVSNSADPTTDWKGFKIDADPTDTFEADFPRLGLDADGVYLASNNFPIGRGRVNMSLVSIPKADLLSSTPTVANAQIFRNLDLFQYGWTIQPALDFGLSDGRAALLATDIFTTTNVLKRADLFNSDSSSASLSSPVDIPVDTYTSPPLATQPDGSKIIRTNDYRFSGNVFEIGDSLWATHNINVGGRAAIRWYEIDERTNAVLQSGTIGDPEHDYFYPSIAVNPFGDVVIGFNRSGLNEFISSYAVLGETNKGVTTFGNPLLLRAGTVNYQGLPGGDPPDRPDVRWGDYSATVIDPSDPFSFWTFQEVPRLAIFIGGDTERVWTTQITQVKIVRSVPEPASVMGLLAFAGLSAASWRKRKNQSTASDRLLKMRRKGEDS